MTRQEAGRLGGLATVERHGRGHMSAIGKRGFARVVSYAKGGRLGALKWLVRTGKVKGFRHTRDEDRSTAAFDELWARIWEGSAGTL